MFPELRNWFLKQVRDQIRITEVEYPSGWTEFLRSRGIPVSDDEGPSRCLINWSRVPNHHELDYGLVENEDRINAGLAQSALAEHPEVLMDFGYMGPVIAVPAAFFVVHWLRFVASTNFMGTVVATADGSLFMEFTDDAEHLLLSNFPIAPSSRSASLGRDLRRPL